MGEVMTDNLKVWNALKRPPKESLKLITFGALKNKHDIDPMWRVKAMTEQFGPCGVGWKFEIKRVWCEPAPNEQTFAFAEVWVYLAVHGGSSEWSDPIPGVGGNMLVQLAKGNPKENDEGYKMAVTDALGTALKMIGVAADIYMGKFDGSKYKDEENEPPQYIDAADLKTLKSLFDESGADKAAFLAFAGAKSFETIPAQAYGKLMGMLNKKLDMINSREPGSDDS